MQKKQTTPDDPSSLNLQIKIGLSSMYDHEVAAEIERRIRKALLQTSDRIEELLGVLVVSGIMDEELIIRVTAERQKVTETLEKKSSKKKGAKEKKK